MKKKTKPVKKAVPKKTVKAKRPVSKAIKAPKKQTKAVKIGITKVEKILKPKTVKKELPKVDNVEKKVEKPKTQWTNFPEEVFVNCTGCGKKVKIMKYGSLDVEGYQCQKCGGVETELSEDFS